jgi:hypothetical protein
MTEQHLNKDNNFTHQMSLNKSKCWYSNNCLQFLKRADPLIPYNVIGHTQDKHRSSMAHSSFLIMNKI